MVYKLEVCWSSGTGEPLLEEMLKVIEAIEILTDVAEVNIEVELLGLPFLKLFYSQYDNSNYEFRLEPGGGGIKLQ